MTTSVVIPISGGLDSCALAAWACEEFDIVTAFHVVWNVRQQVEQQHARIIAKHLKLHVDVIDMSGAGLMGGMNSLVLAGIAIERAESIKAQGIALAERSPITVDRLRDLAGLQQLGLAAPFAARSKAWVVEQGRKLEAPLFASWSCTMGGHVHCGACAGCNGRMSAFQAAMVLDQTVYA